MSNDDLKQVAQKIKEAFKTKSKVTIPKMSSFELGVVLKLAGQLKARESLYLSQ